MFFFWGEIITKNRMINFFLNPKNLKKIQNFSNFSWVVALQRNPIK